MSYSTWTRKRRAVILLAIAALGLMGVVAAGWQTSTGQGGGGTKHPSSGYVVSTQESGGGTSYPDTNP